MKSQRSHSIYKVSNLLQSIEVRRKKLVWLSYLGQDGIALYRIFLESESIKEKLTESSAKEMYLDTEIGSGPLFID